MSNRFFRGPNLRRRQCVTKLPARAKAGPVPSQSAGISRILVATDFSDSAEAALDQAVLLANKFEAFITLVHVVEPHFHHDDLLDKSDLDIINARRVGKQKEKLEILRQSRVNTKKPSAVFLTEGTAWVRITEIARKSRADMIVLGTRGSTGLKHVLVGSTAERVVRHAECPVLVVHARR